MIHVFHPSRNNAPETSAHSLYIHEARYSDPYRVIDVDVDRSRWFEIPVRQLGSYGLRRFENWIILEHPRQRLKVRYRY